MKCGNLENHEGWGLKHSGGPIGKIGLWFCNILF